MENAVLTILGSTVCISWSFWNCAFSSSGVSCSSDSKAPEKGMMVPPPCALTHSWIFTSHLFFLRAKSFFVRLIK